MLGSTYHGILDEYLWSLTGNVSTTYAYSHEVYIFYFLKILFFLTARLFKGELIEELTLDLSPE